MNQLGLHSRNAWGVGINGLSSLEMLESIRELLVAIGDAIRGETTCAQLPSALQIARRKIELPTNKTGIGTRRIGLCVFEGTRSHIKA